MTKTLHRVEVFDGKGVVVTLPTLKGPAEAARFIEGAVEAAGPEYSWRYVNSDGAVELEIPIQGVSK